MNFQNNSTTVKRFEYSFTERIAPSNVNIFQHRNVDSSDLFFIRWDFCSSLLSRQRPEDFFEILPTLHRKNQTSEVQPLMYGVLTLGDGGRDGVLIQMPSCDIVDSKNLWPEIIASDYYGKTHDEVTKVSEPHESVVLPHKMNGQNMLSFHTSRLTSITDRDLSWAFEDFELILTVKVYH